jgi:hypothetical protein
MEEEMVRVVPEPSVRIPGESDRPIRVGQREFCCPISTMPFCLLCEHWYLGYYSS